MPIVLAFNPGSNSLKFDIVEVSAAQRYASEGKKLLSGVIDDIGKRTELKLTRAGKMVASEALDSKDFSEATERVLDALDSPKSAALPQLKDVELVGVRVVHGGDAFSSAVRLSDRVRGEIERREPLAPLHNANSLRIFDVVRKRLPGLPVAAAFDTAFHHTIPEHAWRYPIPRGLADRYGIRRFGFHGLSHRYMLERYAQIVSQPLEAISVVTLHLESGSSAAAIGNGKSVDTSMGLTPLEGLMMGTRSGSVDPALAPFLMREASMRIEDVMEILEKKSGLLGVSGITLDTRELRKRKDDASKLALKMFGYRVRHFVGAYLAVLGQAQAVIFGGGIGENTPEVRAEVCTGLGGWGLDLDSDTNWRTFDGDVRITTANSRLAAWVIHVEEGMQVAHECAKI